MSNMMFMSSYITTWYMVVTGSKLQDQKHVNFDYSGIFMHFCVQVL